MLMSSILLAVIILVVRFAAQKKPSSRTVLRACESVKFDGVWRSHILLSTTNNRIFNCVLETCEPGRTLGAHSSFHPPLGLHPPS